MPDLAKYIRKYHQRGYSVSALKSFLQQQGYSEEEIEKGIKGAYVPENHNKFWIIGGVIIVILIIVVAFLIFLIPSSPKLTLSSSSLGDTFQGERASFQFKVNGIDSSYIATLSYKVTLDGNIVDSNSEQIDVSEKTFLYSITPLEVGKYIVSSTLEFEGSKKMSSFGFYVKSSCGNNVCESFESSDSCSADCPIVTCGDGICSYGESCDSDCSVNDIVNELVCGDGVCSTDEICSADCNTCGNNVCESGENFLNCDSDCSAPVCGDNVCETGETCSADCSIKTGMNKFSRYELINYVSEGYSSSNAESVAKDCETLTDIELKDICFSELSKVSDEAFYCKFISVFTRKDDCYITYAYESNDFSVCASLEDRFKRQTCEGLEQQRALQKKYS